MENQNPTPTDSPIVKPIPNTESKYITYVKSNKKIIGIVAGIFVLLVVFFAVLLSQKSQKKESENMPTPTMLPSETPSPSPSITPEAKKLVITNTPTPTKVIATLTPTQIPTPTVTPTPTIPPDTEPPHTNIYYPQNGGEMSYTYPDKGGYCVVANAPTDNRDRWQQIQTQFHFDSEPYSPYATERAFMCVPFLPNGSHTFTYRSKDSSGNVEAEQTISFTVNIPSPTQ
jgi:hypothetical protein